MRWILVVALLVVFAVPVDARGRQSNAGGYTQVRPYVKRDGAYVQPHVRTNPNSTKSDNMSGRGNVNPFTGKKGTRNPW